MRYFTLNRTIEIGTRKIRCPSSETAPKDNILNCNNSFFLIIYRLHSGTGIMFKIDHPSSDGNLKTQRSIKYDIWGKII